MCRAVCIVPRRFAWVHDPGTVQGSAAVPARCAVCARSSPANRSKFQIVPADKLSAALSRKNSLFFNHQRNVDSQKGGYARCKESQV